MGILPRSRVLPWEPRVVDHGSSSEMSSSGLQDFLDKVVVVTGASSGIGAATAVLFAQRGAKLTLCGRDEDRLSATLDECFKAGGSHPERYITVIGDITQSSARQQILDRTLSTFQRIDVLLANAGIVEDRHILDETEASFDRLLETNLKSTFFLVQAALPHLVKTKGNIVSVSSVGSTMICPSEIVYGMTKAAIDYMTRSLALEFAPQGVRVNAVNPTLVWTRIYRELSEKDEYNKLLQDYASSHPLHGRACTPEEVGEVILFLASPAARFVTGECVKVDGAATLVGLASNF